MVFIRVQNTKKNSEGHIVGGSASIVESVYVPGNGKNHCRQVKRESLGKIVLMESRTKGVFLSKTRGLVCYDSENDEFVPVDRDEIRTASAEWLEPRVHTMFGDSDATLRFMETNGFLRTLRDTTSDDMFYSKILCHVLHDVLRDGSRMGCDRFVERSMLGSVLDVVPSVLRTDSVFYRDLGRYEAKEAFFKSFVKTMRGRISGFGSCCYIDSTPLPNEIKDLPSNRYCTHGLSEGGNQTRLVLIIDIMTGYPVWYDLIPGNVLDLSTVVGAMERVKTVLDVSIDDIVLDAGYVSKGLIGAYNLDTETGKTLIARMPAKNGYPFHELFDENHRLFANAKYAFVREGHTYFGVKRRIVLFEKPVNAYVYVDMENASATFKAYMSKHPGEYEKLTMKEKNRVRYKGGFFVLVSNVDVEPTQILEEYYGRTFIEHVFKTGKEYIRLLPLNKENADTVNGKILQDVMGTILCMMMRKKTVPTGRSLSDYIYDLQSVMCHRDSKDTLSVELVNKQARAAYSTLGVKPMSRVDVGAYRKLLYLQ